MDKRKTSKVMKALSNNPVNIGGEPLIIPNHSGDHAAGRLPKAPTEDTQLVNKKYVDDAVEKENLWDRTGTELYPHTEDDNVNLFKNDRGGGSLTANGVYLDHDQDSKFYYNSGAMRVQVDGASAGYFAPNLLSWGTGADLFNLEMDTITPMFDISSTADITITPAANVIVDGDITADNLSGENTGDLFDLVGYTATAIPFGGYMDMVSSGTLYFNNVRASGNIEVQSSGVSYGRFATIAGQHMQMQSLQGKDLNLLADSGYINMLDDVLLKDGSDLELWSGGVQYGELATKIGANIALNSLNGKFVSINSDGGVIYLNDNTKITTGANSNWETDTFTFYGIEYPLLIPTDSTSQNYGVLKNALFIGSDAATDGFIVFAEAGNGDFCQIQWDISARQLYFQNADQYRYSDDILADQDLYVAGEVNVGGGIAPANAAKITGYGAEGGTYWGGFKACLGLQVTNGYNDYIMAFKSGADNYGWYLDDAAARRGLAFGGNGGQDPIIMFGIDGRIHTPTNINYNKPSNDVKFDIVNGNSGWAHLSCRQTEGDTDPWFVDYDKSMTCPAPIYQKSTAEFIQAKWTANSVTINGFTSASAVADLQTANDGNVYTATETAGGSNYLIVDFTNVTAFNWVKILGSYDGSGSHGIYIDVYNWTTTSWDQFDCMQDAFTDSGALFCNHDFHIDGTCQDHIGDAPSDTGKVRIRFNHSSSTVANHKLYLDEVSLQQ